MINGNINIITCIGNPKISRELLRLNTLKTVIK